MIEGNTALVKYTARNPEATAVEPRLTPLDNLGGYDDFIEDFRCVPSVRN